MSSALCISRLCLDLRLVRPSAARARALIRTCTELDALALHIAAGRLGTSQPTSFALTYGQLVRALPPFARPSAMARQQPLCPPPKSIDMPDTPDEGASTTRTSQS